MKIVIIEDNKLTVELLSEYIRREKGWQLAGVAADGETGVELIASVDPDVALLDLILPHEDGFWVLGRLRRMCARCKVIVLSGLDDDTFVKKALMCGASYYLMKPVHPLILMERIRDVTGGGTELFLSDSIDRLKMQAGEKFDETDVLSPPVAPERGAESEPDSDLAPDSETDSATDSAVVSDSESGRPYTLTDEEETAEGENAFFTADGEDGDEDRNDLLTRILTAVGLPANLRGYVFVREAVLAAAELPATAKLILKEIYRSVAARCGVRPGQVEQAIRHAIEVALHSGKFGYVNQLLGMKVYYDGDRITNGQFIAFIADRLRFKSHLTEVLF